MAYGTVYQDERELEHEHEDDRDDASSPPMPASPDSTPPPLSASRGLFLGADNTSQEILPRARGLTLSSLVQSITSRSADTKASYEVVEADDYTPHARTSPISESQPQSPANIPSQPRPRPQRECPPPEVPLPLHIPRPQRRPSPATAARSTISSPSFPPRPVVRTASGRSVALRHPTPDLQVLKGAYTGNIELLEKTAERLSMTSSIDDAIKSLHDEQKRTDSRRSSLLSQTRSVITRQVSNASSIVEMNSVARSGGYSPAGFMMSPKGSISAATNRGRSASKSSRFGSRPEPELEGRPLDSFVTMHSSIPPTSPILSRTDSIPEHEEESPTLTRPVLDFMDSPPMDLELRVTNQDERPTTSASTSEEQVDKMFAEFDGIHVSPEQQRVQFSEEEEEQDEPSTLRDAPRRASMTNRMSTLSMARPQSYADPVSGQQMVYYPAPVPMMLNLPQKLSKNPSSIARNKRRSQVMSNIPAAARQSAIWLPDVLETDDEPDIPPDDMAQQMEYVPQHQRASMGGRRLTQDLSHMPAQLRASTYFELPTQTQTVELKEQSAVATLDSILDASANAPVSAFTDHAFAGHLGNEVYGKSHTRNSKSTATLLEPPTPAKKRHSFFSPLHRERRGSQSDLLDGKEKRRASTVLDIAEPSKVRHPIDDEDEDEAAVGAKTPLGGSEAGEGAGKEEDEESDEGQLDDQVYHGPPTTLLAELQLRKQQQKLRTQHITKQFPQGIHSTLLEMDAVAQVEKNSRKHKRVALAWEDPDTFDNEDDLAAEDEDVPLAVLYAKKSRQLQELTRPMGLMERREMEDNEPLSRRRDRLQGRPAGMPRASTMMNLSGPVPPEEEEETLAQRVRRLKEAEGTQNGLPATRPVSGDFASEMMSQFGPDLLDSKKDVKGKGKEVAPPEEEETLGQRRKRLQAEREARAKEVGHDSPNTTPRPALQPSRSSMANILTSHPSAGADRQVSYEKPVGGLLAMHQQQNARSSTMFNFDTANMPSGHFGQNGQQRLPSGGFKGGLYNDAQGGIVPPPQPLPQKNFNMFAAQHAQFPQPSIGNMNGYQQQNAFATPMMPFTNPYAMAIGGYNPNMLNQMPMGFMPGMNMNTNLGMQMGQGMQPLNQGQIDMVERWRQSVMQ